MTLLEICVDSPEGAALAAAAGADRIELCAELAVGGVTPSAGAVAVARSGLQVPLMVLVRPRSGHFCHSPAELAAMAADIEVLKASGVDGVVIGALTDEGAVDVEIMARLIALARPLQVTFHRAFDHTRDPHEALAALRELGVERVLTSGQAASANEGIALLADLVSTAGDSLSIMPGGGIRAETVTRLVAATGCREVHAGPSLLMDGPVAPREGQVGGADLPADHQRRLPDAAGIKALRSALGA
jgi:copper homeostasis protein